VRIGTRSDLSKLTEAQVRDEIRRTEDLIAELLTDHNCSARRYGAHNPTVDLVVRDMGYHMVLWNGDSEDWKKSPTSGSSRHCPRSAVRVLDAPLPRYPRYQLSTISPCSWTR
jgi:peptidoglycan/xylan/chitin deacetylase (PgdA/CDA1 family)